MAYQQSIPAGAAPCIPLGLRILAELDAGTVILVPLGLSTPIERLSRTSGLLWDGTVSSCNLAVLLSKPLGCRILPLRTEHTVGKDLHELSSDGIGVTRVDLDLAVEREDLPGIATDRGDLAVEARIEERAHACTSAQLEHQTFRR